MVSFVINFVILKIGLEIEFFMNAVWMIAQTLNFSSIVCFLEISAQGKRIFFSRMGKVSFLGFNLIVYNVGTFLAIL